MKNVEIVLFGTFPIDSERRDTFLKCVYRDGRRVFFSDGNRKIGANDLAWRAELPADPRDFPEGAYLLCTTPYGISYCTIVKTPRGRAIIIIKIKGGKFASGKDVIAILKELKTVLPVDYSTVTPESVQNIWDQVNPKMIEYDVSEYCHGGEKDGLVVYKNEQQLVDALTHIHQKGYTDYRYIVFHTSGVLKLKELPLETIEPMYYLMPLPQGVLLIGNKHPFYMKGDRLDIQYSEDRYKPISDRVTIGKKNENTFLKRDDSKFEITVKSAKEAGKKFEREIMIEVTDEDGKPIKKSIITCDHRQVEGQRITIGKNYKIECQVEAEFYEPKKKITIDETEVGETFRIQMKPVEVQVMKKLRLPSGKVIEIDLGKHEERSETYQELKELGEVLRIKKPRTWLSKLKPGKKAKKFLKIFSAVLSLLIVLYFIVAAFVCDFDIWPINVIIQEQQQNGQQQSNPLSIDRQQLLNDTIWYRSSMQSSEMQKLIDALSQKRVDEAIDVYSYVDENKLWAESKPLWNDIKQRMFEGTIHRDTDDTSFDVLKWRENLEAIRKSLPASKEKKQSSSSDASSKSSSAPDSIKKENAS